MSSRAGTSRDSPREDRMRAEMIDFATDLLGAKYKYAGKDPRGGFDCSGFVYYVMRNFGITVSGSSRSQAKEGRSIPVNQARAGDLIFYKRSRTGPVFHVSLVVSNDRDGLVVIHSTSRGVVIDNVTKSSWWRPKVSSARRVIN